MTRVAAFAALLAVGIYGGTLLKPEPPKAAPANVPQISTAISHGDATIEPVRWGRFYGRWGGYYPYYGGYTTYYGGPFGGYYSPYYGGMGYGYGYSPYYSWWW